MAELLERHRGLQGISRGIAFFGALDGKVEPLDKTILADFHVVEDGFVIGVSMRLKLRPIYDDDQNMVIVRLSDGVNTLLTMRESQLLAYNGVRHPSPNLEYRAYLLADHEIHQQSFKRQRQN